MSLSNEEMIAEIRKKLNIVNQGLLNQINSNLQIMKKSLKYMNL